MSNIAITDDTLANYLLFCYKKIEAFHEKQRCWDEPEELDSDRLHAIYTEAAAILSSTGAPHHEAILTAYLRNCESWRVGPCWDNYQILLSSLDTYSNLLINSGIEAYKELVESAPDWYAWLSELGKQAVNVTTPEGKAAFADAMLLRIEAIPDAIIRYGYMQRLARDLNLPVSAIEARRVTRRRMS